MADEQSGAKLELTMKEDFALVERALKSLKWKFVAARYGGEGKNLLLVLQAIKALERLRVSASPQQLSLFIKE